MAVALFQKKVKAKGLQGWYTGSAGTWARDGYPAAENSRKMMAQFGMDITRHRSRVVRSPLLESADLILTMERGHKEAIQAEFPQVKARVFLLSELVGAGQDIRDPYGGPLIDYRDTAQELDELIDKSFDRIIQLAEENSDH
jgi:protein-tyrosine-phosphatase